MSNSTPMQGAQQGGSNTPSQQQQGQSGSAPSQQQGGTQPIYRDWASI